MGCRPSKADFIGENYSEGNSRLTQSKSASCRKGYRRSNRNKCTCQSCGTRSLPHTQSFPGDKRNHVLSTSDNWMDTRWRTGIGTSSSGASLSHTNDFSTVTSVSGRSTIRVTLSRDGSMIEVEKYEAPETFLEDIDLHNPESSDTSCATPPSQPFRKSHCSLPNLKLSVVSPRVTLQNSPYSNNTTTDIVSHTDDTDDDSIDPIMNGQASSSNHSNGMNGHHSDHKPIIHNPTLHGEQCDLNLPRVDVNTQCSNFIINSTVEQLNSVIHNDRSNSGNHGDVIGEITVVNGPDRQFNQACSSTDDFVSPAKNNDSHSTHTEGSVSVVSRQSYKDLPLTTCTPPSPFVDQQKLKNQEFLPTRPNTPKAESKLDVISTDTPILNQSDMERASTPSSYSNHSGSASSQQATPESRRNTPKLKIKKAFDKRKHSSLDLPDKKESGRSSPHKSISSGWLSRVVKDKDGSAKQNRSPTPKKSLSSDWLSRLTIDRKSKNADGTKTKDCSHNNTKPPFVKAMSEGNDPGENKEVSIMDGVMENLVEVHAHENFFNDFGDDFDDELDFGS